MSYLPSHKIPLMKVSEIVELLFHKNNSTISEIGKYANVGVSYTRDGLKTATILKMIEKTDKDTYDLDKDIEKYISCSSNIINRTNMMRHYLQKWSPFMSFINFMLQGYNSNESSTKVKVLYSIECTNIEFLSELFINWGEELNIFKILDGTLKLEEQLDKEYKDNRNVLLLEDNITTRLYILENLGQTVFNYLKDEEVTLLVEAYSKITNNAGDSIHTAGKVFEDFLRRVAEDVKINVKDKNGINQIVNILYNNKNSVGILENKIHNKQYSIGVAIADIRNMTGHNKEAKSNRSWNVSILSAITCFNLVICTIRSIYLFVFEDKYEF